MVDDTKVNKASDKGTGIRALKSEKIKGVDVMAVSYTHLSSTKIIQKIIWSG